VEHRRIVARNLQARLTEKLGLRGPRDATKVLRFVTLTLKTSPAPLGEQLDRLYKCFKQLRDLALWRKNVTGGILFLELTIGRDGGWHPHLHILASGSYLPQDALSAAWLKITGDSYIVDVRLVRNPAIAASYVAKYASKVVPASLTHDEPHLVEAILALRGRRTFSPFGSWTGWQLSKPPPDDCSWDIVAPLNQLLAAANGGDPEARRIVLSLHFTETHENEPPNTTGPPDPEMPDMWDGPESQ